MPELGLEYLSVFGLHPVEFIHFAADLGCRHVSLNLGGPANRLPQYPPTCPRNEPRLRRQTAAALHERQVNLSLCEGFALTAESSAEELSRDLDSAAEIGAKAICVIALDRDVQRTYAQLGHLTELAAERGMVTTTEVGAGGMRRLDKALAAAEAIGNPSFRLLIYTMHYFRFGGTLEALSAVDPAVIGHVQLCDVPMPASGADYAAEALWERRAPGDGDLPLREFVRLVPPEVVIGLEIPIRSQAEAGIGPRERLAICVEKARALWSGGE